MLGLMDGEHGADDEKNKMERRDGKVLMEELPVRRGPARKGLLPVGRSCSAGGTEYYR